MELKNTLGDLELSDVLIEGNMDVLEEFIRQKGIGYLDGRMRGILTNLILEGLTDLAISLISGGRYDLNLQDINGYSSLHFAVQMNSLELVQKMIEQKLTQIDIRDKFGNTPLYKGVTENVDINIPIFLLEHGANPLMTNVFGYSPLRIIKQKRPVLWKWLQIHRPELL